MYIWWALDGATTVCSILCTFIMEMKCNISFTLVLMSIALSRSLVFVLKDNTKQFFFFPSNYTLASYIHVYMYVCNVCMLLLSTLVRGFAWGIYSRNVRTYVRVCHAHECQFALTCMHAEELICHVRALTRETTYRMPSLAMEDREEQRFLTMEDR